MNSLNKFDFKDTDTRVTRYIMPLRIVKEFGNVENAETLLSYRDRQIQLVNKEYALFHKGDALLLDFGYEFSGGITLSVGKMKAPSRFRIRFGESVGEALAPLGFKNATNDHSMRDFEAVVPMYSTNSLGDSGLRFCYIELVSDEPVCVTAIQGRFTYQPFEYYGSFECDNERLNKIYNVSAYTCHLCIQNNIWDGIKRDRLVWIGDLSPELKTVKYLFGEIEQIPKALELSSLDAPLPKWINTMPTYSLWWLINLEEWHFYTGNRDCLEKFSHYALPLIEAVYNVSKTADEFPGTFIDWQVKGSDCERAGAHALLIRFFEAAVRVCKTLGKEYEKYESRISELKSTTESCGGFKQIAAFLLDAGIAEKDSTDVFDTKSGLSTFMSYYILTAMSKIKGDKFTLDTLAEYYGAMLDIGATTFFEDFDLDWLKNACRLDEICPDGMDDIHGDRGNHCYVGFRHSLCHGWASGPVPFLTEYVLGINITGAGCSEIEIKPHLADLNYAKGSIATPFGKLTVCHEKLPDGTISTTIDAPKQIKIKMA